MDLFWDFNQDRRIADVEARKANRDDVSTLQREIAELTRRVDRLSLAAAAMWELLTEHTDITGPELSRKVEEIDLRDGRRDGRIGPVPVACASCRRTVSSRHQRCVYCGNELPRNPSPAV